MIHSSHVFVKVNRYLSGSSNDRKKNICPHFLKGAQRITTGRLVPPLPGAKLQPDLPQVPKSPQDLPPGEPGLAQRPQMASHMVRRYFPMTQITLTMYNHNRVSIFLTMHSLALKQVFEGLRLLPEDADGAGALARRVQPQEPQEARQVCRHTLVISDH